MSEAVQPLDGVSGVSLDFTVMTDEEREDLRIRLHGDPGATAGAAGPRARRGSPDPLRPAGLQDEAAAHRLRQGRSREVERDHQSRRRPGSARPLGGRDRRRCVRLRSPACWARMREPVVIDQMLVPPEQWGVRCISMGYFVPEGQAVIWRGPMLHKALEQFLTDVFWDDPEYLLVDMPPVRVTSR